MTHPDAAQDWHGRLPVAEDGPLDDEQRALAEQLHARSARWAERAGFAGVDSADRLIGPFNAFVHRPGPGKAFGDWVGVDQRHSSLPATIREIVILTVGVAWRADYEIYAHVAVARSTGLAEDAIDAIRQNVAGDALRDDELAAHRFADELVRTHRVTDTTYATALETFGRDGVLDLVHLTGMYLATSALLNAFEVPATPIPDAN